MDLADTTGSSFRKIYSIRISPDLIPGGALIRAETSLHLISYHGQLATWRTDCLMDMRSFMSDGIWPTMMHDTHAQIPKYHASIRLIELLAPVPGGFSGKLIRASRCPDPVIQ